MEGQVYLRGEKTKIKATRSLKYYQQNLWVTKVLVGCGEL
jgi:hypothetical protein